MYILYTCVYHTIWCVNSACLLWWTGSRVVICRVIRVSNISHSVGVHCRLNCLPCHPQWNRCCLSYSIAVMTAVTPLRWQYSYCNLALSHRMVTSPNGNIFRGTGPLCGEFTGPRNFDIFFDLLPNKRLSKQLWGWWFETPSNLLWRHCNGYVLSTHFRESNNDHVVFRSFSRAHVDITNIVGWQLVRTTSSISQVEVCYNVCRSHCICFFVLIAEPEAFQYCVGFLGQH